MTKLSETHSSPSSLHVSLCSCLARMLGSLRPAASCTCPCCWGSVAFQQWCNVRPISCSGNGWGVWWELSSHLSSLYLGTGAASGRGPQSPAVWMKAKQKLLPPGELHESVLFFLSSTSSLFFFLINSVWHTALHFSRAENKGGIETQRKKTVKCGNCSFFLFSSCRSFYQY